ncbi:DEAD-like helicase [Acanthamoeba polyphaga mimivirus]|uniref:DEAD-like helicase n=1 Tax=Acanthamoeba polyphaga mimivirus Kroon TaxID=3069720 RepID=A0A0G2YC65_9VIRU|nr:DEAD-like helicase [Acanthamoeba polyphaga mimivirus]AKI80651.1 DEAD-like helicase [Acanthamoeba polyphaga mimivirus Kroon]
MKIFYNKNSLKNHLNGLETLPKTYLSIQNQRGTYNYSYLNEFKNFFKTIKEHDRDNKSYVHEMLMDGQKRKPYLDIEKVYPDEKIFKQNYKSIITKLQKDIIHVFKTEYNQKITIDDILILDSSGKVDGGYKMSYHIIIDPVDRTLYYSDSKCSESSAYHLLACLIDLDNTYEDEEYLDKQVYKSETTLRIIGSYKLNDNRYLKPIDNKTFQPIDISVGEKYRYLISYVTEPCFKLKTPIYEQTTIKTNKINTITINSPSKTCPNEQVKMFANKFHPTSEYKGLGSKYGQTYYNFNYTDRNEKCPVTGKLHTGNNGFYIFETDKGYFLKCFSTHCNDKKAKFIGSNEVVDDIVRNAQQIDQKYLIMEGGIGDKPEEPVKKEIINWLSNNNIKTLAIKSAMGTGKTTMIKRILEYDTSIKKILWITHRQTLSKQISGSFSKYGFVNYMDIEGNLFEHDRLILQIDSLMRIKKPDETCSINFKQYDMVIIDEIEGNMNHYTSPFLKRDPEYSVRDKFRFVTEIIDSAKKLIVLDADFGMRAKLFIDNFGRSIMINNKFKPMAKKFIVTNDLMSFDKKMFADFEKGAKICVISMSAKYLESIEPRLSKFKYVMHTSRTDDKLKNELENVNDFWKKFQICCFSPTIECGVDFNDKHFDKIYCILKNGSKTCSQRSFLQMVGRIRQINDPNIICYYKGPTSLDTPYYTYEDVIGYFKHYENINGRKILENVEYKKQVIDGEIKLKRVKATISLFDHIQIYNEVEQLNKNHNIFITVLNKLIQRGGHTLDFNIVNKPEPVVVGTKHERVLANIDETKFNISELKNKQSKNLLTNVEKLVLEKHFFMKKFGITDSTNKEEFMEFYKKYAGKEALMERFQRIFSYKKDTTNKIIKDHEIEVNFIEDLGELDYEINKEQNNMPYDCDSEEDFEIDIEDDIKIENINFIEDNEIDNIKEKLDNYVDAKEKARDKIIIDMLNIIIGKEKDNYECFNYILSEQEYKSAILNIAEKSIYFTDEQKNRILFGKTKGKLREINEFNVKNYMNTIQCTLKDYGIVFKRLPKRRQKGKFIHDYSLSVNEQIKDIVDFKYGLNDNVKEFPNLFHK